VHGACDATRMAALFTLDVALVGFDGSEVAGRVAIEAHLVPIFASHRTPVYIVKIHDNRTVNSTASHVCPELIALTRVPRRQRLAIPRDRLVVDIVDTAHAAFAAAAFRFGLLGWHGAWIVHGAIVGNPDLFHAGGLPAGRPATRPAIALACCYPPKKSECTAARTNQAAVRRHTLSAPDR
jgi:uncharacterized protein (TIGR02246 family)